MRYHLLRAYLILVVLFLGCKENTKKRTLSSSETPDAIEAKPINKKEKSVKIIPIEHATMILEWGEMVIYVDPVGGAEAFKNQKLPDLILVTDIHGDHLSLETLESLNTEKAKIIMPQAVADKMPKKFVPQIDVLYNGDTKERYDIHIKAIPMYNLREEAKKYHEKGRGNGYLLTLDDQRIYISGDTEDIPEMRNLKNIDKAFICMNLPYTMTPESAAKGVLAFAPKQVYPYHYRGNPDVSDVSKFKELVNRENPEIEVVQLDWYPHDPY